jgi:hypothetical protein
MITFLIIILTVFFALGSVAPLFITEDVRDVVSV